MSGIAHSTGVSVTDQQQQQHLVEWLVGEKVTCADDKKNEDRQEPPELT